MDKRKRRKIVVITACIVVLLGVFLGVEYNKYREKPLLSVIPRSRDEVGEIQLWYSSDDHFVVLDAQQAAEFWDILDGCTVKFWSTSGLSGRCADVWLYPNTSSKPIDAIITFSEDGRIMAYEVRAATPKYKPVSIYRFVEGEEEVYQFLYAVREAEVIC